MCSLNVTYRLLCMFIAVFYMALGIYALANGWVLFGCIEMGISLISGYLAASEW
jgi:hypothetical protein